MYTYSDHIDKHGCREGICVWQADSKHGLWDCAGLLPWWHCYCFPADDELGVQAGLHRGSTGSVQAQTARQQEHQAQQGRGSRFRHSWRYVASCWTLAHGHLPWMRLPMHSLFRIIAISWPYSQAIPLFTELAFGSEFFLKPSPPHWCPRMRGILRVQFQSCSALQE